MIGGDGSFQRRYARIKRELNFKHGNVYLILAPPRTSSTALARVFWQHPEVGFYSHEPFDCFYHQGAGLGSVLDHLRSPAVASSPRASGGRALLIKEMSFQAGSLFDLLVELSTAPAVFVLRDPRLSISSRMRKARESGGNPLFPLKETGWEDLCGQVDACRSEGRPYLLVDAHDFREAPVPVLRRLFSKMNLRFDEEQVRWEPTPDMRMGNLQGAQDNFYTEVLGSRGIEPGSEVPSTIEDFPLHSGLRSHVRHCVHLYESLRKDPELITATTTK